MKFYFWRGSCIHSGMPEAVFHTDGMNQLILLRGRDVNVSLSYPFQGHLFPFSSGQAMCLLELLSEQAFIKSSWGIISGIFWAISIEKSIWSEKMPLLLALLISHSQNETECIHKTETEDKKPEDERKTINSNNTFHWHMRKKKKSLQTKLYFFLKKGQLAVELILHSLIHIRIENCMFDVRALTSMVVTKKTNLLSKYPCQLIKRGLIKEFHTLS